jgi:hypothetical protein
MSCRLIYSGTVCAFKAGWTPEVFPQQEKVRKRLLTYSVLMRHKLQIKKPDDIHRESNLWKVCVEAVEAELFHSYHFPLTMSAQK